MRLWLEWIVLFVGFPALAYFDVAPISKFLLLVPPVAYGLVVYWRNRERFGAVKRSSVPGGPFALRLALVAGGILLAGRLALPGAFLEFPRSRPGLFAAIVALYPFLSAWPQEFMYRTYFFSRYERLFPGRLAMVGASAASFSLLHVIYDNGVAVAGSLAGGLLFAAVYARTRNIVYPWIEHTVYGLAVFASGFGQYFYEPVSGGESWEGSGVVGG